MLWFTSDTHFGHAKSLEYMPERKVALGVETVEEMDQALLKVMNETVGEDDVLFHLGDFVFFQEHNEAAYRSRLTELRSALKCRNVKLLWGNHDKYLRFAHVYRDVFGADNCLGFYHELRGREVSEYSGVKVGKDRLVVLSHYPLAHWNESSNGSFHLHGHCHGDYVPPVPNRSMDVGVDNRWGFVRPLSYLEVAEAMATVKVFPHHHAETGT